MSQAYRVLCPVCRRAVHVREKMIASHGGRGQFAGRPCPASEKGVWHWDRLPALPKEGAA